MKQIKKALVLTLTVLLVLGCALFASADNWDGEGGTGNAPGHAVTGGYSMPSTDIAKLILGYRFTVLSQSGGSGVRVGHSIEVYFTNSSSGLSWSNHNRPHSGSNLSVLNSEYEFNGDTAFNSALTTTNPSTGLESWIAYNKDGILAACEVGRGISTDKMYIVAEPLFATYFNSARWLGTFHQYMQMQAKHFEAQGLNANYKWTGSTTDNYRNIVSHVSFRFPYTLYATGTYSFKGLYGDQTKTYKGVAAGNVLTLGNGTVGLKLDNVSNYYTMNGATDAQGYAAGMGVYSYETPAENKTQTTYKIYFALNGGSGGPANGYITRTYGANVTFPTAVPTKTGYTFSGWAYYSGGDARATATTTATSGGWQPGATAYNTTQGNICWTNYDTTYVAIWKPNIVNISYCLNGGTVSGSGYSAMSSGQITNGTTEWFHKIQYGSSSDTYNASTFGLTRPGYTFAGWKVTATGKILDQDTKYDSTVYASYQNASVTTANTASVYCLLDAQWKVNYYDQVNNFCKYDPYNNTWTWFTSKTTPAAYGSYFTCTTDGVATPKGYRWSHFYKSGWTVTGPKNDVDGNGHYYPIEYTVTYDANGGTGAPAKQTFYMNGIGLSGTAKYSSTVPTRTGYTFTGWYCPEMKQNLSVGQAIPDQWGTHTLVAQWTPKTIKITLDKQGGTGGSNYVYYKYDGQEFFSDAACTNIITKVTLPAKSGNTFTGYSVKSDGGHYFIGSDGSIEDQLTDEITSDATLYAQWTPVAYTVTFKANGHGTAPAAQHVNHGNKATNPGNLSATGYTFGGWYKEASCTNKFDFNTAITGNITLYAKWTINTYTVTFNANGHGTAPAAQRVTHGNKAVDPGNLSATGYTFGGWYKEAGCTNKFDFNAAITGNITLYAKWTINTYTVTFNANGHGTAPAAQRVTHGNKAVDPGNISATGYIFGGWYQEANCTNAFNFDTAMTGNITLYAKWTPIPPNTYTVSFNANGHGTAPGAQSVAHGSKATNPGSISATGYTFGGWYKDAKCTTAFDFNTAITGDITLYAKWMINTYTVTFNANGHGTAPAAQRVNHGSKATNPGSISATGYTFGGWYKDSGCTSAFDFNTAITGNTTVYAKWTINTYTVTFNANGHGTAPAAQSVTHGSKATNPGNLSATGYTFGGWYRDANCTTAFDFNTAITGNVTVYAKWTINRYTVTFNVNGHGTVPAVQTVDHGSKATNPGNLNATGYTFGGWYRESGCTNKFDFNTAITGNVTVYAKWTINTYTVTFNANGHGTAPAAQRVNHGNKATNPGNLSVEGYTFGGWYRESGCTNRFDFNTAITGNITLYAKWTINTYTVTFKANGHGTAPTAQRVNHGSKATNPGNLNATGYTFGGWYKEAACTNRFDFNTPITGNTSVYAKWTANTYRIYFALNGGSGGPASGYITRTYGANVTFPSAVPTKAGYTFGGWLYYSAGDTRATATSTAPSGTYQAGATANNADRSNICWTASDTTYVATWKPNTYTVSYNANGGSGSMANSTATYNANFLTKQNAFTKTGYTFVGWNEKADGTGTWWNIPGYANGTANASYSGSPGVYETGTSWKWTYTKNITLYAQWKVNYYDQVTNFYKYDPYNSSWIWFTSRTKSVAYGSYFTCSTDGVATPKGFYWSHFSKAGWTVTGPKNDADGHGHYYPIEYTVTYNANGGTGAPAKQTFYMNGIGLSGTAKYSSTVPTRTGYTFTGWYCPETKQNLSAGQAIPNDWGTHTLVAQWRANTYTITYNANGGSGSMANSTATYDANFITRQNAFSRYEYIFLGWNEKADGTGTWWNIPGYQNGTVNKSYAGSPGVYETGVAWKWNYTKNITLYAQWKYFPKPSLYPVAANAPYREGTEVITSFRLVTKQASFPTSAPLKVRVRIYNAATNQLLMTMEKPFVCPENEVQLCYFRWTVPTLNTGTNFRIVSDFWYFGAWTGTAEHNYAYIPYKTAFPENPQYEASQPSGWTKPAKPNQMPSSASWTIWTCDASDNFTKVRYGLNTAIPNVVITPKTTTAYQSGGRWYFKAGYGFTVSFGDNSVTSLSGYTMPSSDAYTKAQYGYLTFPEFQYSTGANIATVEKVSGTWQFHLNPDTSNRVHYTPIWYPDGSYYANVYMTDIWTPAGAISIHAPTVEARVEGDMYDDWWIGH